MLGILLILSVAQGADVAMTTVAQGVMSGIREPRQVVVRSTAEWAALWKAHTGGAPPPVDFARDMVAAVFLGTRNTGGFSVQVTGARRAGDALVLEYAERRPGQDAIVTMVLTFPFHMVKVARHDGPIKFEMPAGR